MRLFLKPADRTAVGALVAVRESLTGQIQADLAYAQEIEKEVADAQKRLTELKSDVQAKQRMADDIANLIALATR